MRRFHSPLRSLISIAPFAALALPGHAGEWADPQQAMQSVQQTIAQSLRYEDDLQVAVVVKGGVSLGAYEAGVNWSLLRYLRGLEDMQSGTAAGAPKLMAAAGASAGAINGVLSAAYWCSRDVGVDTADCKRVDTSLDPDDEVCDTIDRNLIRDTWLAIDIMALLDKKNRALDGDREDNAVFSRKALREAEGNVLRYMGQPRFRNGCEVPIGITLTRADPVRIDNAGVEVSNQRLVAPLSLTASGSGTLDVSVLPLDTDDTALRRSIIHLDDPLKVTDAMPAEGGRAAGPAPATDLARKRETLFQAIKASSSFPVAFAPIKLSYCIRYQDEGEGLVGYRRTGADTRCLRHHRRQTSYFVDGGVFDNDPIGVVRQLVEATDPRIGATRYINIDPGNRRQSSALRRLDVTPFNQPGDTLEVELLTGPPTDTDGTASTLPGPERVRIRLCDVRGALKDEFDTRLYATGPRTRRFVGSLHTVAAAEDGGICRSGRRDDGVIATCQKDEIRVFHSTPPERPCEPRRVDPDTGRVSIDYAYSAVVDTEPQGLSTQLGFVVGAVQSARNNELYKEIIGEGWRDGLAPTASARRAARGYRSVTDSNNERPIFQAARLTPLVGDFIFAFGAFLDERFREFDYYAGVYDGIFGLAEFACHEAGDSSSECLADNFQLIYSSICPDCSSEPKPANVVMRHLIELDACGVSAVIDGRPDCKPEEWRWIDDFAPVAVDPIFAGANACRTLRTHLREDDVAGALALAQRANDDPLRTQYELLAVGRALLCSEELTRDRQRNPFIAFIKQLAEDPRFERGPEELDGEKVETAIGRMLAKYERPAATWYYPLAEIAVSQLLPLERQDIELRNTHIKTRKTNRGALKTGLAIAGLAAETAMADRTGWQWHLSSIPSNAGKWSGLAPFLPSELAVDTRNGGAALFWEAGWRSAQTAFGLSLRAAPYLRQRFDGETVEFAELTGFVFYKTNNALLSSAGLGPTWTHTWTDPVVGKRETLGASTYLGLLGDKIRITYGTRSFDNKDFDGDNIFWQLSVRDIPGFVYWAREAR